MIIQMRWRENSRSVVIQMALAMTTLAMLGSRYPSARSSNSFLGRSMATAFVTRSNTCSKRNANRFETKIDRNRPIPLNFRNVRLLSSRDDGYDDAGRRVRTPRPASDGWGNDDDWGQPSSSNSRGASRGSGRGDDWDDFDPWNEPRRQPQRRRGSYNSDYGDNDDDDWGTPRRQRNDSFDGDNGFDDDWGAPRDRSRRDERGGGRGGRGRGRGGGRGRGRGRGRDFQQEGRGGKNENSRKRNKKKGDDSSAASRSINMNALEGAGFVHLYGLSSVLNALSTGRRDLTTSMEKTDTEAVDSSRFEGLSDTGGWDDSDDDFGAPRQSSRKEEVKPQAQFRPYLFVLDRKSSGSDRRGSKASAAEEVLQLAEERGVPIAHVDKGILNVLSGNRPHQGFALRCGKLYFESLSRIPLPTNARGGSDSSPSLWLVLDEVVDPQNLGALLRSAYFLGGKKNNVGILVCSKNSAPPSPIVSATSAGALEVVDVHSTSNLPRTLNQAREDGFRIIGASASVPSSTSSSNGDGENLPPPLYDLQNLPVRDPDGDNRPILLVLGSEGHGLRTLVAKACTEFVRIPSGMGGPEAMEEDSNSEAGVDSLNVSVSAGIMLWHLIHSTGSK